MNHVFFLGYDSKQLIKQRRNKDYVKIMKLVINNYFNLGKITEF